MLNERERELIADAMKAVVSSASDLCSASEQITEVFNQIYERGGEVAEEEGGHWELAEGSLQNVIHEVREWVKAAQKLPSCPFVDEVQSFLF